MYMVEVDVTSWKDLKMRSVQLSRLTCSMVCLSLFRKSS